MKINWVSNRQTYWLWFALFLNGGAIAQPKVVQSEAKPVATLRQGFFSPQSYRVQSDLDEALSLTPKQKKQMQVAHHEVITPIFAEQLKRRIEERQRGTKPTAEERKAARIRFAVQMFGAIRELRKRYIALLNADQKALVETVDATVKAVADEVGAPYDAKMRTARGGEWNALARERDEKIKTVAAPRLKAILEGK